MPVLLTKDQLDAGREERHRQQRAKHEVLAGLVRWQLDRGKSQAQVARILGVSRQTVGKIARA